MTNYIKVNLQQSQENQLIANYDPPLSTWVFRYGKTVDELQAELNEVGKSMLYTPITDTRVRTHEYALEYVLMRWIKNGWLEVRK
jgi:hypothetical protein